MFKFTIFPVPSRAIARKNIKTASYRIACFVGNVCYNKTGSIYLANKAFDRAKEKSKEKLKKFFNK